MIALATVLLLLDGKATYYAPGIMERVAANRGLSLENYDGGAVLNDCQHLGRRAWIEHGGNVIAVRIVDCAQAQHRAERERRGYVAEVSYQQAAAWGGLRGPVDVRVHFRDPRREPGAKPGLYAR